MSTAQSEPKGWVQWLQMATRVAAELAMTGILVAVLALYGAMGIFNRYVADDYGQVLAIRLRGFWGQQFAEYRLWSGRFTSTAAIGAVSMLNQDAVRVLPGVMLALWVVLIYWLSGRLIRDVGRVYQLLLAAGIVFTTIQVTPSPFLSIYWMTGSLTYLMPLLLGTIAVTILCTDQSHRRRLLTGLAILVVAFSAGGADETYLAAQTAALAIALCMSASPWIPTLRRRFVTLACGLVGSLLAAAVVLAAPGNAIRTAAIAQVVKDRPSLLALPGTTVGFAANYFEGLFAAHWLNLLAVAALAGLVGVRSQPTGRVALRRLGIAMCVVTVAAFVVVTCAIAPSAFEEARLTDDYAQIVLVYICVAVAALLGWTGGLSLRVITTRTSQVRRTSAGLRRVMAASLISIVVAGVIAGPVIAGQRIISGLPAIEHYAATKDDEAMVAEAARVAGRDTVVVPPLSMVDDIGIFSHPVYEDLTRDPSFWINRDEARFYGLRSLAASSVPSP